MTTEQPPTFREVGVEEAKRLRDAGYRVIDVREPVEWDEGHLPGATLIPLADVASRIESEVPDRDTPLLVHCLSGVRSARASSDAEPARLPHGRQPEGPSQRVADGRRGLGGADAAPLAGAATPIQPPGAHPGGWTGRPAQAAGFQGAAHRRRRPGIADRALSDRLGRRDDRPRRRRRGRRVQPPAPGAALDRSRGHEEGRLGRIDPARPESRDARHQARGAPGRGQRRAADRRLRRDRRRDGQLRHSLRAERRGRQAAQAGGSRLDLSLGRPGHDLHPVRRAVLPLHVPDPAPARAGARLRRGRRARGAAGDRRPAAGQRGLQAAARSRRDAGRPAAAVRRGRHHLRRGPHLARPGLPGLRRRIDPPETSADAVEAAPAGPAR